MPILRMQIKEYWWRKRWSEKRRRSWISITLANNKPHDFLDEGRKLGKKGNKVTNHIMCKKLIKNLSKNKRNGKC